MRIVVVFILILAVFQVLNFTKARRYYCRPSLCPKGKKHIACNNYGAFSSDCASNARIMTMTPEIKRNILIKHNRFRGRIARGGFAGGRFRPAIRMATMQWGTELSKLALLNVKQCAIRHDECRNTKRFHYAGQNLAKTTYFGLNITVNRMVMNHINLFFDEYNVTTRAMMQSYPEIHPKEQIGHFTQMMQEKATHVGCAVLRENRGNNIIHYTACNYAYTNVYGSPVYRTGNRAGTRCRTGRNPRFRSLCSRREKYNENVLGF